MIHRITLDLPTIHGDLIDVPVIVNVQEHELELEPYSWGQPRGTAIETDITIENAMIGDLVLSREQLAQLCGLDTLHQIEDRLSEEANVFAEWRQP